MTPELIQWVNEQSNHQLKRDGLTKGIEIAVGFAEWLLKNNMAQNGFGGWGRGSLNVNVIGSSTEELLIEFLKTIEK